jgi:hypothetical protein
MHRFAGSLRRFLPVLAAGGLLFGCADPCAAQQLTAGVAVGLSTQRHGDSDRTRLAPGLEGSSLAGLFFVDRVVRPRISIGGEMTVSGEIKGFQARQSANETIGFRSRHHDTIVSGMTKVNLFTFLPPGHRPGVRVELAAVTGLGFAWRHTIREGTTNQSPCCTFAVSELSNVVVAGTLGFDATFVFSPRTAMVVTGRYQLLNDDDRDAAGFVRRGVASTLFRFGFGMRFAF